MSAARERILARIRAGLGDGRSLPPVRPQRPEAPMACAVDDPVADFLARAEALQSTVAVVATLADVPGAVASYLAALGEGGACLDGSVVAWPEFAALDWRGAGVPVEIRATSPEDRVGITGAFCGIAETGTLLLHSGAGTPSTTSLLPETHICVLAAHRVLDRMEQAFAAVLQAQGELPRALNFISGPSRTADIEQTIVIGAHGPRRVHVVLVSTGH